MTLSLSLFHCSLYFPIWSSLCDVTDKLQSNHVTLPSQEPSIHRRNVLAFGGVSLVTVLTLNYGLTPSLAWAGDDPNGQEDKDEGVVGAIKSFLDPDEKTKSGKVLPKAYLKSVREVVRTLRESLKENPKDNAKFRRTADAAKESIREYLGGWRGNPTVVNEASSFILFLIEYALVRSSRNCPKLQSRTSEFFIKKYNWVKELGQSSSINYSLRGFEIASIGIWTAAHYGKRLVVITLFHDVLLKTLVKD